MSFITRAFQESRRLLGGEHNKVFAAAARPHDTRDYVLPELDGSGPVAADFPLGKTQSGASLDVWLTGFWTAAQSRLPPVFPICGESGKSARVV